ncbi:xanthine dehydrogenase accessory protein XdhC [Paracoccus aestuarii]|uniref:Xanthine dehydrogenase accessory protein XdhC n=1 Tax=Paracoccus aestuarii TaxID=453842 RepID=A0A418ZR59_9RHOB|nr:xanthine dehydrogenase accessory protein XdhC [Paracoccus aestuarii]RJK98975.1 xanthine dehydrogenase accessory protein XdhC [Paracoccus aestuarii]WCQ98405.1 xanthine dehydrogenase accessory protein XdhC [Paracoccus aestuarii]
MIRVRVISARGSTPREAGAEMIVTPDATQGTIGGGQLEYMAIDRARQMLARGEAEARMDIPLGPEIGQCCGGRVVLSLDRQAATPQDHPDVLIFGAGHVGRVLSALLQHLPVNALLIDSRAEELARASGPTLLTPLPEAQIRAARPGTAVIILTHDHALDFLLAAEALVRPDLAYIGMIGSATKRAQFTRFARDRGLDPAPLTCPIGAGLSRDKRPEIIATFTAAELMARLTASSLKKYPCDS